MDYIIKQGQFKPQFTWPKIYYKPKQLIWEVEFDGSEEYTLTGEDEWDIGKLVGVGFFPSWRAFVDALKKRSFKALVQVFRQPHHRFSARVGWRWIKQSGVLELVTYVYDDAKPPIAEGVNSETTLGVYPGKVSLYVYLTIEKSIYRFTIIDKVSGVAMSSRSVPKTHDIKWAFMLKPRFPGDQPAPHDTKISVK